MASEDGYERQLAPRPAAARPFATAESFGAGLGGAVSRLADTVNRGQLIRYENERRAKADRELTQFMANFAAYRENMDGISREGRTNADPGGENHAMGMAEAVEAGRESLLDGITEDNVRRQAEQQFGEYALRFKLAEADWAEVRRAEKTAVDAKVAGDIRENRIRRLQDPRDYLEEMEIAHEQIDALHLPVDVKQKMLREADQGGAIAFLRGRIDETPDVAKALIAAGTFDEVLEPGQIEALLNNADVEIRSREVAARSAAALQSSALKDEVSLAIKQVGDGHEVDDAELAELERRAIEADLPEARRYELRDARVANQVNREFRAASPGEIGEEINRLDAQRAQQGADADPALTMRRNHLEKLRETRRRQIDEDQLGWASQNGIETPELDLMAPTRRAMDARIHAVEAAAGSAGLQPRYLTEDEATELREQALGGKTGFTTALSLAWKFGREGGRAASAARQIMPGDEQFAYMVNLPFDTWGVVWNGRERLKQQPNLIKEARAKDPEAEDAYLRQEDQLTRALAGLDQRQQGAIRETVRYLQAGFLANGNGELTPELTWRAINQAVGAAGVPGPTMKGGIARWGSSESVYLVPRNMTATQFGQLARSAAARSRPVNPDGSPAVLSRARPRLVGPNRYNFLGPDGRPLRLADGSLFTVEVE